MVHTRATASFTSPKTSASPRGRKSPRRQRTSRRSERSDGCLDASLSMLHQSMETNAKAYEYLVDESCGADERSARKTPTKSPNINNSMKTKQDHLESIMSEIEEARDRERSGWASKYESAKEKTSHYKVELRDNLRQRLQWLERQVQQKHTDVPSLMQSSTNEDTTTTLTSSGSDNLMNPVVSYPQEAVEVTLDGAQVLGELQQTRAMLEETQHAHASERTEWADTLGKVQKSTIDGNKLHEQMEAQLQKVASGYSRQLQQFKEKNNVLEQLMQLMEKQHEAERKDWKESLTEGTLERSQFEQQQRDAAEQIKALREQLDQSKIEAKENIIQVETLQAQMHRSKLAPDAPLSPSSGGILKQDPDAPSPRRRVEWDDKLDRAMAERDIAQQQLQQSRKDLDESQRFLQAKLEEQKSQLEQEWAQKIESLAESHEKATERLQDYHKEEIKRMHDEHQVPPSVRKSTEKRNELSGRLRKLEEQHAVDKGNWKLQLESALAKTRQVEQELTRNQASWTHKYESLQNQQEEEKESILNEAQAMHKEEMESWKSRLYDMEKDHKREISRLTKEQASVLEEAHKDHVAELASIQAKHEQDRSVFRSQLALLEEELAVTLRSTSGEEARAEYETSLKDIRALHSQEVEALKAQADKAREEYENIAKKCREEYAEKSERSQAAMEEQLNQSMIDRKALENSEKEAMSLREERDNLKVELERLSTEVTEYRADVESKTELLHQRHNDEMVALRRELNVAEDRLEKIEALHSVELSEKQQALNRARGETDSVLERTNELSRALEELRETHRLARAEWSQKLEAAERDREAIARDTESRRDEIQVQDALTTGLDTMRKELASLLDERNGSSENWQARMEEVLARSVGEMSESADVNAKQLVEAVNTLMNDQDLRLEAALAKLIKHGSDTKAKLLRMNGRLEGELERERTVHSNCKEDLDQAEEILAAEVEKRVRAEEEIAKLNDQADAYSEELINLQAANTGLEETLREAELRMEAALRQGRGLSADADAVQLNASSLEERTTPLLEEALALAEGLTDIVHGRGKRSKDDSVMSMLESVSELLDQHDGLPSEACGSMKIEESASPQQRHVFLSKPECVEVEMRNELDESQQEPEPVLSPEPSHREEQGSKLAMVVDQLYDRCHLLERERTELMEVSMDLLHSAKESNAAEIDAALAVAQRKAAEEMQKIRQQNLMDHRRLYHKLCGNCQRSMLNESKQESIAST